MSLKIDRVQLEIVIGNDQARKRMREIDDEVRKLNNEIKKMQKSGADTSTQEARIKALRTEYDKLTDQIGLTGLSLRELRNRQRELNSILQKTPGDSPLYKQYKKQLDDVNNRMRELRGNAKQTEGALGKFTNGFNKFLPLIASSVASITGTILSFRKLSEEVALLDDIYADVMKTTGMTREEVLALNEDFKKLDTRTSREELNKIAEEGGRIGILKEDILEFTDAMDKANVALGDSFTGGVEEIASKLGKLKMLFSETKEMGVEKAYLSIGSAINDLGADGVASERNIAEFTTRIGSLPEALKPSIADTLALGAAFEESGIEAEVASRAYGIVLNRATKKTDEFARIMRLSVQEVEDLINTNPLEFFLKFSESLKGLNAVETSRTLNDLKINADGANKVIGAASNNTERFRELLDLSNQSFEEGVSLINEYNIKNTNLNAKLEKSRKEFKEARLELGERLNPALLKSTNLMTYLIKILPDIFNWFEKYGGIIVKLTALILAYNAGLKAQTMWTKLALVEKIKLTAANVKETASMVALNLRYIAGSKSAAELGRSIKALWGIMKLNPWGAAITALTAVGILVYELIKRNRQFTNEAGAMVEVNKKVADSLGRERAELDLLLGIARNEKISKEERIKAINRLNEISPEYLGNLNLENINTDAARISVEKYTTALMENAKHKAISEKMSELYSKRLEKEAKIAEQEARKVGAGSEIRNIADRNIANINKEIQAIDKEIQIYQKLGETVSLNKKTSSSIYAEKWRQLEHEKQLLEDLERQHADLYEQQKKQQSGVLKDTPKWGGDNSFTDQQQFKLLSDRVEWQRKLVAEKEKELKMTRQIIRTEQNLDTDAETDGYIPVPDNDKKDKKTKTDPMKAREDSLREQYRRDLLQFKQSLQDKKITEEEYNQLVYQLDIDLLKSRKDLYNEYSKETTDIDIEITDKTLAEVNRRYKLEQEAAKKNQNEIAAIEKDAEETRKKEEENRAKEAEQRRRDIMDGVAGEHQQLFEALYELNIDWLNDFLEKWGVAASRIAETGANIINAAVNFNKAEEMAVERRYNKMIQAAGNNSRKVQQLEEEKEKKLHEVRAKYADKQFILTVAQVIASTAVSAMEAFKAMAGIPVVGPALGAVAAAAAVAYGASQIAVAKQQRDAAKEGYRSGGFTGQGDDRDEAGVVHRNEFVNTADAVRNPHVKRFLDVFDVAQKNGTIRMLNTTQILERAKLANNAPTRQSSVDNSPAPTADLETIETLNRLRDSVDRFTEKLDIPIKTYTVIHGTQGARRQNELYDRIMKNARL